MRRGRDKVSIILTTCCQTPYRLSVLKFSIDSLFRNTIMRDKEFIICDNGDEKQTAYLETLRPQKHLIFGSNIGIVKARNAGAEASTGDYLCFIDGDILYQPEWIRTLYRNLNRNKGRKLIASGMFNSNHQFTHRYLVELSVHWQIWRKANCGCLFMSREAWDDVGPWPDFWKLGTEFISVVNKRGYRFLIPIPPVAAHIDNNPSYDKKKLRDSYIKGQTPVWEIIR